MLKELIFYLSMKIKIISWNERGLNAKDKVVVKSLLKKWKTHVVCLQETKLSEVSREGAKEIWANK